MTAGLHRRQTGGVRYLFTGRTGRHLRPDNVTGRFNQVAVAAGVRPLGPHQIRHLIASNLLDAGYGITKSPSGSATTLPPFLRYYTGVNAARRLQATDHIADLLTSPGVDGSGFGANGSCSSA